MTRYTLGFSALHKIMIGASVDVLLVVLMWYACTCRSHLHGCVILLAYKVASSGSLVALGICFCYLLATSSVYMSSVVQSIPSCQCYWCRQREIEP